MIDGVFLTGALLPIDALTAVLAAQLVGSALGTQIFSELQQPHWRFGLTALTVLILAAVLFYT